MRAVIVQARNDGTYRGMNAIHEEGYREPWPKVYSPYEMPYRWLEKRLCADGPSRCPECRGCAYGRAYMDRMPK